MNATTMQNDEVNLTIARTAASVYRRLLYLNRIKAWTGLVVCVLGILVVSVFAGLVAALVTCLVGGLLIVDAGSQVKTIKEQYRIVSLSLRAISPERRLWINEILEGK